jgi:hypothetical protein
LISPVPWHAYERNAWRLLNGCSYCFHIFWRSNGTRSARWFSLQCGSSCPKVRNP